MPKASTKRSKPDTSPSVARPFDLATGATLDEVITIHCIDGPTGEPLGLRLDVAPAYSQAARRADFDATRALRERTDLKDMPLAALHELAERETLARCVVGWDLTEHGQPCPATPEKALALFAKRGDVYQQVKVAHEKRHGFFSPASTD